jgi:hypothetical protein
MVRYLISVSQQILQTLQWEYILMVRYLISRYP